MAQDGATLSDLPDEVLMRIATQLWRVRSLALTNKQLLSCMLQSCKARRLLMADQHFEQQLSHFSQQLHSLHVTECALRISWTEIGACMSNAARLLHLLTPHKWLVDLMLDNLPVAAVNSLPALQRPKIWDCGALTVISNLPQLQALHIDRCQKLITARDMPLLCKLRLQQCKSITAISNVTALSELCILECSSFGSSVEQLTNLQQLSSSFAPQSMPIGMLHELPILQRLELTDVYQINSISGLTALQSLFVHNCTALTSIPDLPALQRLSVIACKKLSHISNLPAVQWMALVTATSVSCISSLPQLEDLHMTDSGLVDLSQLPKLTQLALKGCNEVASISHLTGLQSLTVERCMHLTCFSPFSALSSLRFEGVYDNITISNQPALAKLSVTCRLLTLSAVPALRDLTLIGDMTSASGRRLASLSAATEQLNLQRLIIKSSSIASIIEERVTRRVITGDADALAQSRELTDLQYPEVEDCRQLRAISNLAQLATLKVERCGQLAAILDLPQLQKLTACHCEQLSIIAGLPQLTELTLMRCGLHKIASLPRLQNLEVNSLPALACIQNLAVLTSLHTSRTPLLTSLDSLPKLQTACFSDCGQLPSLNSLPELRELQMYGSNEVSELCGLSQVRGLAFISFEKASQLTCVSALTLLGSLDLTGCFNVSVLKDLPALQHLRCSSPLPCIATLTSLKTLAFGTVDNPATLQNIVEQLPMLEHLTVGGCVQMLPLNGSSLSA